MFIVYNRVDDLAEPTRDATYLLKNGLEWAHASRTVLLVTHRVSTIRDADRILVLNQGRIEDVDSHDEIAERWAVQAIMCDATRRHGR